MQFPDLQKPRRARALRFVLGLAGAMAAAATPATQGIALTRVAPGVYAFVGATGAPTPENAGRVGNLGVIVGPSGTVVIGTGTRDADGEALLEAVRRLSAQPVVLAINTHAAPEHVLGNAAFARRGIPILAHRQTDRFLTANCDKCIAALEGVLGEGALGDTRLVRPKHLIDEAMSIEVGGLRLDLLHYGWTQQPGTLAVFEPASGVLFGGGMVSLDRIPDLQSAHLPAWMRALRQLAKLPATALVPGYGPIAHPGRISEMAGYLSSLHGEVATAFGRGQTLAEATVGITLPAWRDWTLYEPNHRRNVHFEYLRIELTDFDGAVSGAR